MFSSPGCSKYSHARELLKKIAIESGGGLGRRVGQGGNGSLLAAAGVGADFLGALSMGWLESLDFLQRRQKLFEIIAGTILIFSGLYLINEYFLFVNIWM